MANERGGRRANRVIPFLQPAPARLSDLVRELAELEASGIYSNFGPQNARFEQALVTDLFGGAGQCVTVSNATAGLMLALARARGRHPARRFALMPSFTFAATAHAALWSGLTPLLCDIAADTWLACPESEARLVARHGAEIAAIVPCTTFGNPVDLARYRDLASACGCALVVDAAAALGTLDDAGQQFGRGASEPVVFSMHATKTFATLEGGVVYSADERLIADLRSMANFGFEGARSAVRAGFNAKLDEVTALLALAKLRTFPQAVANRVARETGYRAALHGFAFQENRGRRTTPVFMPVLLPRKQAAHRDSIRADMLRQGVGTGAYFDPHVARQPYFADKARWDDLPASDDIAARIIALPMSDRLTQDQVTRGRRGAAGGSGAPRLTPAAYTTE